MENTFVIRNTTPEDFCDKIIARLKEELKIPATSAREEPRYLTRQETADLLKISLQTLHQYTKTGRLRAYRVGSRVLYKMEELENGMNAIPVSRFIRTGRK